MRSKNHPIQIITAGDMSQSSLTSIAVPLLQIFAFAMQANFSGSPVGTLKLQCSLDYYQDAEGNVTSAGNWIDIANSSYSVAAAGQFVWNVADSEYPWVRMVYTKASGTGTLNGFCFPKGI